MVVLSSKASNFFGCGYLHHSHSEKILKNQKHDEKEHDDDDIDVGPVLLLVKSIEFGIDLN